MHAANKYQVDLVFGIILRWLQVTASVVPSSPDLVTLKKETLRSSETSALTRAKRRNITEDAILQLSYGYWTHKPADCNELNRSIVTCIYRNV
jgi:hypothetical protein